MKKEPKIPMVSVWGLNHRRMVAIEKLRSELEAIGEEEKREKAILLEVVPKNLRTFLSEDLVISNLVAYGHSENKIGCGEPGFETLARAKRTIALLNRVWEDNVHVSFKHESGLFRLVFKVVGP